MSMDNVMQSPTSTVEMSTDDMSSQQGQFVEENGDLPENLATPVSTGTVVCHRNWLLHMGGPYRSNVWIRQPQTHATRGQKFKNQMSSVGALSVVGGYRGLCWKRETMSTAENVSDVD